MNGSGSMDRTVSRYPMVHKIGNGLKFVDDDNIAEIYSDQLFNQIIMELVYECMHFIISLTNVYSVHEWQWSAFDEVLDIQW